MSAIVFPSRCGSLVELSKKNGISIMHWNFSVCIYGRKKIMIEETIGESS